MTQQQLGSRGGRYRRCRGTTLVELSMSLALILILFSAPLIIYRQMGGASSLADTIPSAVLFGRAAAIAEAMIDGFHSWYVGSDKDRGFVETQVGTPGGEIILDFWLLYKINFYLRSIGLVPNRNTGFKYSWDGPQHWAYDFGYGYNLVVFGIHPWGGATTALYFNNDVVIFRYMEVPKPFARQWGHQQVLAAKGRGIPAAYAVGVGEVYGLTVNDTNDGFVYNGKQPFTERIPELLGTGPLLSAGLSGNVYGYFDPGGTDPPYFVPSYRPNSTWPFVGRVPISADDPTTSKSAPGYHVTLPKHPFLTYVDVAMKLR